MMEEVHEGSLMTFGKRKIKKQILMLEAALDALDGYAMDVEHTQGGFLNDGWWRPFTHQQFPTYGSCSSCGNAGPSIKLCGTCGVPYILYLTCDKRHYIDGEKIALKLGKNIEVAKSWRVAVTADEIGVPLSCITRVLDDDMLGTKPFYCFTLEQKKEWWAVTKP